mmetsp:Transcript_37529/g.110924  ORF Transcript_37529/g.110924 Transcript_37529/m.110924 type:complete len:259 (+) Transcript_37529:393-1169(+)
MMPALASMMDERLSVTKSDETTSSRVNPSTPFISPSEAACNAAMISSYVVAFSRLTVRSTTDTSLVGTRNAMPVSLPLRSGITTPTALAAPVDEGMMLPLTARPPRQSFLDGPSTVFCVAVDACTVVMRPSLIPNLVWMTFASGARQLVVQDALDTIVSVAGLYLSSFTPITYMGASLEGAEMTTRLAPAVMCALALARSVNTPVDSTTKSAPTEPQGISAGSFLSKVATLVPETKKPSAVPLASVGHLPCTVSYLSM